MMRGGITTKNLDRMGRRRVLSLFSAMGASATTLNYLTGDAIAQNVDSIDNEIPYVSRLQHTNHEAVVRGDELPKRRPVYDTIERDRYVRIKTAHKAALRLESEHFNHDRNVPCTVSSVDGSDGWEKVINVRYSPDDNVSTEDIEKQVPSSITEEIEIGRKTESIEDIPVRVIEEDREEDDTEHETQPTNDWYYDHEYSSLPGGCAFRSQSSPDPCTVTTPALTDDWSNSRVVVTAGHCLIEGEEVYQPEDGRWVGYAKEVIEDRNGGNGNGGFDAAYFSNVGTAEYKMARDSSDEYRPYEIKGVLTADEIRQKEGKEVLARQGAATGFRMSCDIEEVRPYSGDFLLDTETSGGDSGGPAYDIVFSDEAYIAGNIFEINAGSKGGVWCSLMEKIENEFSIVV